MELDRDALLRYLGGLEWGVDEDAEMLISLLLEHYQADEAYSWLFFYNANLGGTPLHLLELGYHRPVFVEARRLCA